jgi:hypothetical protein
VKRRGPSPRHLLDRLPAHPFTHFTHFGPHQRKKKKNNKNNNNNNNNDNDDDQWMHYVDRTDLNSIDELEDIVQNKPVVGRYLKHLLDSLDDLVSTPFCYLAKKADPISLQLAVNYIENNEFSNNIYVIHFVDDRPLIRDHLQSQPPGVQQVNYKTDFPAPAHAKGIVVDLLMKDKPKKIAMNHTISSGGMNDLEEQKEENNNDDDNNTGENKEFEVIQEFPLPNALPSLPPEAQDLVHAVSVLDSFYAFKKLTTIVIRGGFFCPSCLSFVADYLSLRTNRMIIGVPTEDFPFPFARLNGCRIAIPDADSKICDQANTHLRGILKNVVNSEESQKQRGQAQVQLTTTRSSSSNNNNDNNSHNSNNNSTSTTNATMMMMKTKNSDENEKQLTLLRESSNTTLRESGSSSSSNNNDHHSLLQPSLSVETAADSPDHPENRV